MILLSKNKQTEIKKYLPLIISPLAAAAAVLWVFWLRGFYPFGQRTAAWCDMNQQVVPLLCQLKDILEGKSGWLLSFKNASGMNFFGVFFFFLSSPFSFLVWFVEKEDMLLFANILILMKMMACAVTSSLYFVRSGEYKRLGALPISLLGFIYATSGYVMLFYQNVIWLDIMYLFPLLLISLERLHKKGSPMMYIAVISCIMIVNYYIGYMAVLFLLLTAGVYSVSGIRADIDDTAHVSLKFLAGSAIAAMLSAAVWLPSFMQYLTSGRRTSLGDNLRTGALITDYDTVLPVMFGSAALILFATLDIKRLRRSPSPLHRVWRVMAALLCIPLLVEPINKLWHTGSYMAFPARYAFMTIFLALIMAAHTLDDDDPKKLKKRGVAGGLICAGLVLLYGRISMSYIGDDLDTLSEYTRALSGNESSFKGLLKLLVIGLFCVSAMYLLYKKGRVTRNVFLVLLSALTVIEAAGNTRIYMTASGERNEETYELQRQVLTLSDKIDDDSFYRVKTSGKIFDYNMIGAMGYNSIGHYTSLTNEDYMFAMKRLGYTSVWMEIGTCGGTELTDALLSIGYEIGHTTPEDTIYSHMGYSIYPLGHRLEFGVLTDHLPEISEIPEELSRAEVQQYVYDSVFGSGEQIVSLYSPDMGVVGYSDGRAFVEQGEQLLYRIKADGKTTLYFDCFDRISNELSEPVYGSFSVTVNGKSISRSYPHSKENGLLKLGSFEDETVIVEIEALKDTDCRSFGVFGINTALLGDSCTSARTIGFEEISNGLSGSSDLDAPSEALLTVPYDSGFTLTVNGQKQPFRKALSCFMSFELPAGHSDIELTFLPAGLRTGILLSVIGAAGYIALAFARLGEGRKNKQGSLLAAYVARYLLAGIGLVIFAFAYIYPVLANTLFWEKSR